DRANNIRTFEFDSGFTLQIAPPLGIQVPAVGAAAGGIVDGQSFQVVDGGAGAVTFEFDSSATPSVVAGRTPIRFQVGDSADKLGDLVATAIRQAVLQG